VSGPGSFKFLHPLPVAGPSAALPGLRRQGAGDRPAPLGQADRAEPVQASLGARVALSGPDAPG
jgi:hypothetical protein